MCACVIFFSAFVLWYSHSPRRVATNVRWSTVRSDAIASIWNLTLSVYRHTKQDEQQHRINIPDTTALTPSIANKLVIQFKFSSLWSYLLFDVICFFCFFFSLRSVPVVVHWSWMIERTTGTRISLLPSERVCTVPTIATLVGICECECFRSGSVYIN